MRIRLPRVRAGSWRAGRPTSTPAAPAPASSKLSSRPEPPECPPGWTIGPPDFVIVGVAKAGTTRWSRLLRHHPDVYIGPRELHFWDDFPDQWPGPSDVERYHRYFPRPANGIAGEKTPRYLSTFWAARMINEAAPAAKAIVILRDPIERFHSARTFFGSPRRPGEPQRVASVAGAKRPSRFEKSLVDQSFLRGLYAEQMAWLLESFPPERVLVLQFEACLRDAREQLRRTHRFLGLSDVMPPDEELEVRVNPTRRAKVVTEPERVQVMQELFEHDVLALRSMVPDLDLTLWPNFAHLAAVAPGTPSVPLGSP